MGRAVGLAVGAGVAVGLGVGLGDGDGVGVTTGLAVGATTGTLATATDGDATARAEADGLAITPDGPMFKAPPRASTNPTDALRASTSTTSEPSIAGEIARPSRMTGVGVSATTAAPRRYRGQLMWPVDRQTSSCWRSDCGTASARAAHRFAGSGDFERCRQAVGAGRPQEGTDVRVRRAILEHLQPRPAIG